MALGGLSGEACVERLVALGFTIFHQGAAVTLLARGRHRVLVPHIAVLGPDMLSGILRSAGITETELRVAPRRSGFVKKATPGESDEGASGQR